MRSGLIIMMDSFNYCTWYCTWNTHEVRSRELIHQHMSNLPPRYTAVSLLTQTLSDRHLLSYRFHTVSCPKMTYGTIKCPIRRSARIHAKQKTSTNPFLIVLAERLDMKAYFSTDAQTRIKTFTCERGVQTDPEEESGQTVRSDSGHYISPVPLFLEIPQEERIPCLPYVGVADEAEERTEFEAGSISTDVATTSSTTPHRMKTRSRTQCSAMK